jgi:hypothetical protein
VACDEPIDRGRVDRASSQPGAKVLGSEHVLVENAGAMSTNTKVLDEPEQHRTYRIPFDARPDGCTAKALVKHGDCLSAQSGLESSKIMRTCAPRLR